MKRIRHNIITIILLTALVTSGNFAYALTHLDCVVDDGSAHHKCEMECCQESDCCGQEEPALKGESLASDEENCCTVHIDAAIPQDFAIIQFANTNDNIKTETINVSEFITPKYKSDYFNIITHRFKTSNIYLSVSNLRI